MMRKQMISESEKRILKEAKKVLNSLAERFRRLRTVDFMNQDVPGSKLGRMYTELKKLGVLININYSSFKEAVCLSLKSDIRYPTIK